MDENNSHTRIQEEARHILEALSTVQPTELFRLPLSITISGPTSSGKTHFAGQLIHDLRQLGYVINVYIFYGTDQKMFDDFQYTEKYEGLSDLPSVIKKIQVLDTETDLPPPGSKDRVYNLVIIDDLMNEATTDKYVKDIITRGVSHQGISLMMMYQNMLPQAKWAVTIAQNVHYKVFFYNTQAAGQFKHVTARMSHGKHTLRTMYDKLSQDVGQGRPRVPLVVDTVEHRAWYGLEPSVIIYLANKP